MAHVPSYERERHGYPERRGLLGLLRTGKLDFYEHCIYAKQKKVSFSTTTHSSKGILDYVHSDLWGPSRVSSYSGKCFMMTIINDFSREVWTYFLRHKNEALSVFKRWKVLVKNQTGRKR